ncbi:MAG: GNAT family N-acetyltransferase [Burkholderiales bacterium]
MSEQPVFMIRPASWHLDRDPLHAVRRTVFIEEQQVAEDEEWDDADAYCRHVLAVDADGRAIGTGRLLPDGRIGRMAVLREWRGMGVGSAILRTLLELARKEGFRTVTLHAQAHAVKFYVRHGFVAYGKHFMEAGIPHRRMKLTLEPSGRQLLPKD